MKVLPDVGNNSHREKVLNAKKGTEKPESASVSKGGGVSKVMIPNTIRETQMVSEKENSAAKMTQPIT